MLESRKYLFYFRVKKLDSSYRERMRINTVVRELELEMAEQDYFNEKKACAKDFEEKKVYLREQLINVNVRLRILRGPPG